MKRSGYSTHPCTVQHPFSTVMI